MPFIGLPVLAALALQPAATPAEAAPMAQAPKPVSCPGRGAGAAAQAKVSAGLRTGIQQPVLGGVRLWYRVAGHAPLNAPPVIFLHGGPGSNSQGFATLVGPYFECANRMVYFDQRGSGRSERPWNRDYAMGTLVEDIEALRRHLGVPKVALIGHSFGTMLGLEYAAKYPQNVSHLVLAASVGDAPATFRSMCARLKEIKPEAYAQAIQGTKNGVCDVFGALKGKESEAFFRSNMFPEPSVGERVDAAEGAGGLKNTGELSGAVFKSGLLDYRFAAFDKLTMPVLVISGAKDYQVGLEGPRWLVKGLPRARGLEYANSGHFMFVDEPERFARDVTSFLSHR